MKLIDNTHLEISFVRPIGQNLELLNFPIIDGRIFEDRYDRCLAGVVSDCIWNNPNGQDVVSAGPFMVEDVDNIYGFVTVEANQYYYNSGTVTTDKIIFQIINNRDLAISSIASGLVDIIDMQYYPTKDEILYYNSKNYSPNAIDHQFENAFTTQLAFNHLHPYFGTGINLNHANNSDYIGALNIRKAISHVINRSKIFSEISNVSSGLPSTIIPMYVFASDEYIQPRESSISVSREYMTLAGFNFTGLGTENSNNEFSKFFFSVKISSNSTDPYDTIIIENLQSSFRKIGIELIRDHSSIKQLQVLYNDELIPSANNSGYDLSLISNEIDTYDWDPSMLFTIAGGCDNGTCDNYYDFNLDNEFTNIAELSSDYVISSNETRRKELLIQLNKELFDNLPGIPVVAISGLWGFSKDLLNQNSMALSYSLNDWVHIKREGFEFNKFSSDQTDIAVADGAEVAFFMFLIYTFILGSILFLISKIGKLLRKMRKNN